MKTIKLFEHFISEGTVYNTLAEYLEKLKLTNLKDRLSPTGTHRIDGNYFCSYGMTSVNLRLIDGGTALEGTGTIIAKAKGDGQGADPAKINDFLELALSNLSAQITDPKITIRSSQFPLPIDTTIAGVESSLTNSQKKNEAVTMPAAPIPAVAASSTPAAGVTPPRVEVVDDCLVYICTAIKDPAPLAAILAGAKNFGNAGVTPTEEEWKAAQTKFFDVVTKGLQQIK